jgi:hypothetical protein
MIRTCDQLHEETVYPNLAAILRSGGTLEIGENFEVGTFAHFRKGNQTVTIHTTYRDFAAVLKELDANAKRFLNNSSEQLDHQKSNACWRSSGTPNPS